MYQNLPKPEHQLGDQLFFMKDNKIVEGTVLGVRLVAINKKKKDCLLVEYYFELKEHYDSLYSHEWLSEGSVYSSREVLVKTL